MDIMEANGVMNATAENIGTVSNCADAVLFNKQSNVRIPAIHVMWQFNEEEANAKNYTTGTKDLGYQIYSEIVKPINSLNFSVKSDEVIEVKDYRKTIKEALDKLSKQFEKVNQGKNRTPYHINGNPSYDDIGENMYTDKLLTAEMRTEVEEKETKVVDEETEKVFVTTTRTRTNDMLKVSMDLNQITEGIGRKCDKANGKEMLAAMKLVKEVQHYIARLIIANGFSITIDGVTREYFYLCTGAGGLKQDEHYFVSHELRSRTSNYLRTIRNIVRKSGLSGKYNSFKDTQYISLLLTTSSKLDINEDFFKKIRVINVNQFPLLFSKISAYAINIDKPVSKNEDGYYDFKPEPKTIEYTQINCDGWAILNVDVLTEEERRKFDMHCIQGRMIGCKFEGQFFSFTKMAKAISLTDEECTMVDTFGNKFDIRECSMILDKNSLKYYDIFVAGCNKGMFSSFYDFAEKLGFTGLYAKAVSNDAHISLVKLGKQAWQWMCLSRDDIEYFSANSIDSISKFDVATIEEKLEIARDVLRGRPTEALLNSAIEDGRFFYNAEILRAVEEARQIIIRELMNAFRLEGAMLKYAPDLPRYFAALCGKEIPGLCGNADAVCCSGIPSEEVVVERFPVVGFDLWKGPNTYNAFWNEKFREFCAPCCMYHGWKSTVLKRTAGDDDGDTAVVFWDKRLIEVYNKTNKEFDFPMINFFSNEGEDIDESGLVSFEDSHDQRGLTIAVAQMYNQVGKTSGILGHISMEISELMNDVFDPGLPEELREETRQKINDIYRVDVACNAQMNQLYVDAQKRGIAFQWSRNDSVLGNDWYYDPGVNSMPHKEFESNENTYDAKAKYGTFEALFAADADGWATYREDGRNNYAQVCNYVLETVPVYKFLRAVVTECDDKHPDVKPNTKFNQHFERVYVKDFEDEATLGLVVWQKKDCDLANESTVFLNTQDYVENEKRYVRMRENEGWLFKKMVPEAFKSAIKDNSFDRETGRIHASKFMALVSALINCKDKNYSYEQKSKDLRAIYANHGGSKFYRLVATYACMLGSKMSLDGFLRFCSREVELPNGKTVIVYDAATYAEFGEIIPDEYLIQYMEDEQN